ncbi:alkaline phosphatase family protein [Fictibacillus barbaricus]|uniref:alkaline phosphatase family protein n=1 Tax=Fictibacillus barbaricus TaxID=182136 RepID=UPI001990016C|nr:alkaline phosphatase family protein [Fictibacillus barbaricus]GGB53507.1 hypothetical protein GCM10007199_18970 [Fictibacillus barbaricus]
MATRNETNKRVIVLLLDSLMTAPLQKAISNGQAMTFKFLMDHGRFYPEVISPFPTMSVNVDSTLLTGVYSDQHKVPALVWYHQAEKRIINYGSHIRELFKLGLYQSMHDILYNLNNVHLADGVKTIHEEVSLLDKRSASINTLMYRGSATRSLKVPRIIAWLTGSPKTIHVNSPYIFSYGALSKMDPSNRLHYFWRKYGFHDAFSARELIYLIQENNLPDFSLVYFPDGDKSVHKNGPDDVNAIKKADDHLAEILNSFPSREDAIRDNIWIILGDNGQAYIEQDRNEALVDLRNVLDDYRIVKLRQGVTADDEIVLAVNERMAFIYSLDINQLSLGQVAKTIQKESRIDLIAWREGEKVHVISGEKEGELIFQPEGEYRDEYGQTWNIEGSHDILDLNITDKQIRFGNFPDGLGRLYTSFYSHEGEYIIITVKPGYELIGEGSPTHVGGASHGALHKDDSLVPMIVTGIESAPKHFRFIDLKEWIMSMLKQEK